MPENLTKYLIHLTILIIPAYLIRFSVFGIPTNVLEILILLSFAAYLFRGKCSILEFYKNNRIVAWAVLAIFTGLLVSTLVNNDYRAGFGIIKGWFAVPLIFAWVIYEEIKNREDLKNIIKWLYLGIFWVAIIALGYYLKGNLTYDGRLSAFYPSPNYLAMYLAPGIIIGGLGIMNYKSGIKNFKLLFYCVMFLLILLTFYLTYSYAAWAAAIVSLTLAYLIENRKINRKLILIISLVAILIFFSQWNAGKFENLKNYSRSSLESRIMIWQSAGRILQDNLIWGIGPSNFQNKYLEYQKYFPPYLEWAVPQPHNLYLAFWLESGLLGLLGLIILAVKWLKETIKTAQNQKSGLSFMAAILLAIMLYILIHGLVDTPYWKNDLALVFWIIFSLGLIIKKLEINPIQLPISPVYKEKR